MEQKLESVEKKEKSKENPMRSIFIEKILISASGTDNDLEKAAKLLKIISGERKAQIIASTKRIPDFNVRPGLKVGARITIRDKKQIKELLDRLLTPSDNVLKEKQVSNNHFSFGIEEYIEIPGIEYQRDIGIRGFNVTVVFARPGLRVKRKKIKSSKIPEKQYVAKEEILEFMQSNFGTEFI